MQSIYGLVRRKPDTRILRALTIVVALIAIAVPAEAKRIRFGSGSTGGGSTKVEKIFDLPRIPDLQLPDGRYIDIGRISGGKKAGTLVGYVGSSREFLNLPADAMRELVRIAGFEDVPAFEKHLADKLQAETKSRGDAAGGNGRRRATANGTEVEVANDADANDGVSKAHVKTPILSDAAIDQGLVLAIGFLPVMLLGFGAFKLYRWIKPPVGGRANAGRTVSTADAMSRLGRGGRTLGNSEVKSSAQALSEQNGEQRAGKTGGVVFGTR